MDTRKEKTAIGSPKSIFFVCWLRYIVTILATKKGDLCLWVR